MKINDEELEIRFMYHAPGEGKAVFHTTIRARCGDLATAIRDLTPKCREQSLAITKIEEAMMWANAAIARRTDEDTQ